MFMSKKALERVQPYFKKEPVDIYDKSIDRDLEGRNFNWSWATEIQKNGDIVVTLTEHHLRKVHTTRTCKILVKSDKIVDFILTKCQQNPFAQVHLEGKLANRCCQYELIILDTVNNIDTGIIAYEDMGEAGFSRAPTKTGTTVAHLAEQIVFYRALLAAFRNSIRYDSPYGSGAGSVFNIMEYVRPTGNLYT